MEQIKKQFFGISSLILVLGAFGFGLVLIFSNSKLLGWIYAAILVAGFITLPYSFCAKCPCREEGCGHVLPGKLTRLLPRRQPGPYSKGDITITVIALLLMTGFPQYWLHYSRPLLLAFWGLIIAAIVEIRLFLCPACNNDRCPANRKSHNS